MSSAGGVRAPGLKQNLQQAVGFALYGFIVLAAARRFDLDLGFFGIATSAVSGLAVVIFVSSRYHAAYRRWRAVRKLWDALVSDIRNLARITTSLIATADEQRALLMEALAFCHFLRGELPCVGAIKDASYFVGQDKSMAAIGNLADEMIKRMRVRVKTQFETGGIDSVGFDMLNERLASISETCEISVSAKQGPCPFDLAAAGATSVVCLFLPFGLSPAMGWAAPVLTSLVAFMSFGLGTLVKELHESRSTNSSAFGWICRTCEVSVFEALGEWPPQVLVMRPS